MQEFKDDEGRPWRLALTVASALRVKGTVTVDVADDQGNVKTVPFDLVDSGTIPQTFQILRSQFATIGEVLYAILCKQAHEKGLDKDAFLEGLRGDALDAGAKALEKELVDFFPMRLRKMIGLLAAKMDEVQGELLGQAEAGLETATVQMLMAQSGVSSGKPQESLESTPASGPSDNSSSLVTAA
jgi:hypothetical protein